VHRACPSVRLSICSSVCLSVDLSPKYKNAIFSKSKLFRAISHGLYWRPEGSRIQGLFKEPIIGPLKSKMTEIRHFENRHDVIFFCWRWSDLDKISQIGAEWHVDCGDMVRCRIPIWRTFGQIPWHVTPEPPATLQGAATWWTHCHDSRATRHTAGCSHLAKSMSWSYHIAGCNNSICHVENRFSSYFIYLFLFLMQFGLWRAAAFVSSPIHLLD